MTTAEKNRSDTLLDATVRLPMRFNERSIHRIVDFSVHRKKAGSRQAEGLSV
jgi:hypothetical protein